MKPIPVARSRLVSLAFAGLALLNILLLAQAPVAFTQGVSTDGRWGPQFKMRDPADSTGAGEIAIHMAALRGNADSTHVLFWFHGYGARLMLNATDSTSARHVNVPSGMFGTSGYVEAFCAGQTTLADGRCFAAGGTFTPQSGAPSGVSFVGIFDPKQYGSSTFGWTTPDSMPSDRFYPTCTTLPDGSVLVTQGQQHFELMMYGGVASNDTAQKDLRTYAITSASPFWRGEVVFAETSPPYATTQLERTGHSAGAST